MRPRLEAVEFIEYKVSQPVLLSYKINNLYGGIIGILEKVRSAYYLRRPALTLPTSHTHIGMCESSL